MLEEGWNRKDMALATGLDYKTVLRWLDGSSNPPMSRVASVLERLQRNPADYGITTPRVATGQAKGAWAADADDAPAWFIAAQAVAAERHEAQMVYLRAIAKKVGANVG